MKKIGQKIRNFIQKAVKLPNNKHADHNANNQAKAIDPNKKINSSKRQKKISVQEQSVKDLETILYNELNKDPLALQALQELTNGNTQIPSSETASQFAAVKNSEVALQAIVNSPWVPPALRAQAEEELKRHRKQKAELTIDSPENKPKIPPPRPF